MCVLVKLTDLLYSNANYSLSLSFSLSCCVKVQFAMQIILVTLSFRLLLRYLTR